jgi:hypothetical protein
LTSVSLVVEGEEGKERLSVGKAAGCSLRDKRPDPSSQPITPWKLVTFRCLFTCPVEAVYPH